LLSPYDWLDFVEPVVENRRDHQAIHDAVAESDADGAAELMRAHLDHVRGQLRAIVFGPYSSGGPGSPAPPSSRTKLS
jgi:DNA-binding GntR family transcriptional regulator